jgi:hypothetical protein
LRGEERILDICRREEADTYINLPGGKELYNADVFSKAGIQLQFIDPMLSTLSIRSSGEEGPVLSILDLLMLNPPEALHEACMKVRLCGK